MANPLNYQAIIYYGRRIACIIAMHVHAIVRSILVEAGIEVLERVHQFAVDWAARCASTFFLIFLLLTSFSTTAGLGPLVDELRDAIVHGNVPNIQQILGRIFLLVGEMLLIHVVIRVLERIVSPPFF
jgi:hypothetical protein